MSRGVEESNPPPGTALPLEHRSTGIYITNADQTKTKLLDHGLTSESSVVELRQAVLRFLENRYIRGGVEEDQFRYNLPITDSRIRLYLVTGTRERNELEASEARLSYYIPVRNGILDGDIELQLQRNMPGEEGWFTPTPDYYGVLQILVDNNAAYSFAKDSGLFIGQNIIVLGRFGHGKSSFLNTIVQVIRNIHDPVADEYRGGTSEQHTLTLKCIGPDKLGGRDLSFYDTMGLGDENESNHSWFNLVRKKRTNTTLLRNAFEGRMRSGDRMRDHMTVGSGTKPNPEYRMHAIIFVYSIDIEPDAFTTKMLTWIKNSQCVNGPRIPAFCVCTKKDLVPTANDSRISRLTDQLRNTIIPGICGGVRQQERLIRISNYCHHSPSNDSPNMGNDYSMDKEILRFLYEVAKTARDYKEELKGRLT